MKPRRESSPDAPNATRTPRLDRRRVLLGSAGLAASALAGCLGSGATGGSGGSGNASGRSGDTLPTPVQGDPDADVTVAAFEDYACPHCRSYVLDVLPRIEEQYVSSGRIRYEHHDFPIPVADPESYTAANAARAVATRTDGEAFWTYSRSLFEKQSDLGPELYASLANEMDLDGDAVREAAVNRNYKQTITADRQRGVDMGVEATPTVFVDGSALSEYTFDAISSAIESAL